MSVECTSRGIAPSAYRTAGVDGEAQRAEHDEHRDGARRVGRGRNLSSVTAPIAAPASRSWASRCGRGSAPMRRNSSATSDERGCLRYRKGGRRAARAEPRDEREVQATFTASSAPVAYISQTCRLAAISASANTARRNPSATPSMRICRTTAASSNSLAAGHRDDLLGERDGEDEQRDDGHLHDGRRLLHELVAPRRVRRRGGRTPAAASASRTSAGRTACRRPCRRGRRCRPTCRVADERQQDDVDAPVQRGEA